MTSGVGVPKTWENSKESLLVLRCRLLVQLNVKFQATTAHSREHTLSEAYKLSRARSHLKADPHHGSPTYLGAHHLEHAHYRGQGDLFWYARLEAYDGQGDKRTKLQKDSFQSCQGLLFSAKNPIPDVVYGRPLSSTENLIRSKRGAQRVKVQLYHDLTNHPTRV